MGSELKMLVSSRMMIRVAILLLNTASGFKLCPGSCLCYESSDLVDCRSRGLVQVPLSVPHGTWLMDLSGNKLTEVRTRSFMGLWTLKILLMSNNSIRTLQPQVPQKNSLISFVYQVTETVSDPILQSSNTRLHVKLLRLF